MTDLLHLEWFGETDIFAGRQRGREVAAALALEPQDQVRVATALSEVGREVLASGPATVRFSVDADRKFLVVVVTTHIRGESHLSLTTGMAAARRLVDDVTIEAGPAGSAITLRKRLPRGVRVDDAALTAVRLRVAALGPASPLDGLRAQNADLVHTLDQLAARQQDLLRVNGELEETNRGVLAMYSQLSKELEDTNRGVVALYAELDEKSSQLVEASEAKTRFLRNISHELRTPVNSILGLSDLLADGPLDPDQVTQVDYLRGSARSLLGLVNELLDLARAEANREPVRLTEVDLPELFAELRGTLRVVAAARRIELDIEEPAVRTLVTDRELLSRVLRNLLMNGLKFTERGRVRLTASRRESGQHLELAVTDTGIGIPPELQERVFEEFFQVPGSLQAPGTGTGLGLPYARTVAEALGGIIELVSTPGTGSTFTLVLPAPLDDVDIDVDSVTLGHVLVVDDDDVFRHVLRGMLQGVAERVSEAADGNAALALLRQTRPDVVLLDLRMPNLDGAGTLAELRLDPALREIPVILLTSVDIDADVRRATEPADALLAKSQMTRRRLVSLLHEVVDEAQPAPPGGGTGR